MRSPGIDDVVGQKVLTMMSVKPTIIALILAIFSVAGVWFVKNNDAAPGRTGEGMISLADLLPVNDLDRIALSREDGQNLVFERRGRQWFQTEPFPYPMVSYSIRQLAAQAVQLGTAGRIVPVDPGDADDKAMGFSPPRATIEYQWPQGSLTIELGRLVGSGRGYLRLAGESQVYSVDQRLHQRAIQTDPKEWRDRSLFHNVSVNADSIVRVIGTDRLVLSRDRREWRMHEPVRARVNQVALESFLQSLDAAKVGGFIVDEPDDLSAFGLDDPVASIAITTSVQTNEDRETELEATVQRLLVGGYMAGDEKDRYAMIEGRSVIFRLTYGTQAKLFVKNELLVAPTASGKLASDIKSILIRTSDGEELRLDRDLEKWTAPAYNDARVPLRKVQDLLRQLIELRPAEIVIQPYPRDLEIATITFLGYDQKPIDTVRLAKDPDSERWILENGDDVLRLFPESMMHFNLTPLDFGLVSVIPDD